MVAVMALAAMRWTGDNGPDGSVSHAPCFPGVSKILVNEDAPDHRLVEAARRGDGAALEQLVRRYLCPAYAVALAVLRHPADAEDVANETIMSLLGRLDQCRDPARFAAWLLQSVRNRALRHAVQRRARTSLLDWSESGEPGQVDAPAFEVRRRLLGALEHLSPVQREVVLLHDLQGWTHAEIGAGLEISEVMSRQHLFVARRLLRERLGSAAAGGGRDGSSHG